VRLAATLLQDWYHKLVLKETDKVENTVVDLAFVIAQWPAQWWVREHAADIRELVRGTARLIIEEVKETRRVAALKEVERLQDVVADLERMANAYYKEDETPRPSAPTPAPAPAPPALPMPRSELPKARSQMPSYPRPRGIVSTILAGVWFGTVLSLSVFSSPRWELANHLT
jgi:hypothetical protein